jgi:hypothetical protein
MRKVLLATLATAGLFMLPMLSASAAPSKGLDATHGMAANGIVTNVDYYYGHHHYHHRRWDHGHWHYWN